MRFIRTKLISVFHWIAGFASIIGVFLFIFSDSTNAIIALSFLFLSITIILAIVIHAITSFIRKENEADHIKSSVFTTFETINDTQSIFETYRVIQSKRLILSEIDQNFKWTGSKPPSISSKLQHVKRTIENNEDYDKAILVFPKPLLYNEMGVTHFRAELDDLDKAAKPHLDYRVDSLISIIHYRVILKHKPKDFNAPAKILRKPINSKNPVDYKAIGSVDFDQKSMSYTYHLTNPTVGYYYRLEWEK